MEMRLNQYLAKCGVTSRRGAEQLIISGRVKINGEIVRKLATQCDEKKDKVELDNCLIKPAKNHVYFLLNKPPGYITTVSDPFHRPTVMSLIPKISGIVPVGRLDLDTQGTIILTNDGELINRLIHPKYEIEKKYLVGLNKKIDDKAILELENGVDIGDEMLAMAYHIKKVSEKKIRLSLHEGRNRQIKRMLKTLGFSVTSLIREQFASLCVNDLKLGEWRFLDKNEIVHLKNLVRLN